MSKIECAAFWFRRDLRLEDNAGLYAALKSGLPVRCFFIFDSNILDRLEDKNDKRVNFIHVQLEKLNRLLREHGSTLIVAHGTPLSCWKRWCEDYTISKVFTNRDYEPYARERDREVADFLESKRIAFHTFKDHVICEKDEVVKGDGTPYTVYTPYMKKWKEVVAGNSAFQKSFPSEKNLDGLVPASYRKIISLAEIGFKETALEFSPPELDKNLIREYADTRNLPGIKGTSRLGIHLRFGTVSIRRLVREAENLSETWLNELIWREFFIQVLWHFPHVTDHAFKKEYDTLRWRNDEKLFERWCAGQTGYPIVDAGMRELIATGFMHNRVRMLTACFLTKYLLIDWRWGEAYFAQKLLDYELASNNGNWQWSAGTGCDAAPYFRIFNMTEQTQKFDPDFTYIRKWVPEFEDLSYPAPVIDYTFARKRCLDFYKSRLIE